MQDVLVEPAIPAAAASAVNSSRNRLSPASFLASFAEPCSSTDQSVRKGRRRQAAPGASPRHRWSPPPAGCQTRRKPAVAP